MANLLYDASQVYLLSLNREIVKVYDNAGDMLGSVADAKRISKVTKEQAPAGGVYLGYKVGWKLPYDQAPINKELLPGYVILDSDNYAYVVQHVSHPGPLLHNVWRLGCLALRVLNSTLQLKLPVDTIGDDGSPITTQNNFGTPVVCGIHETDDELLEEFQGKQGYRRWFQCWTIVQDPFLPEGTVVVDNTGQQYTVATVVNKARIDELTLINMYIDP